MFSLILFSEKLSFAWSANDGRSYSYQ